jgi:midasin
VVSKSQLVVVQSTEQNLCAVVLALCQGSPVLLEGPVGCGKTAMVEELARATGNTNCVRMHLDEQMDSKTLLGTYTTTDVPGEFKWQAGALTRALTEGRWVLLEDIDRAPFEVLSAMIPLFESRRMFLPGRGDIIEAASGFQLFATRTTMAGRDAAPAELAPILRAHFCKVRLEAMTRDELLAIVAAKHPSLAAMCEPIMATFSLFQPIGTAQPVLQAGSDTAGRAYSSRDLFGWCRRLDALMRVQPGHASLASLGTRAREDVFMSAADCFVCFVPKSRPRELVTRAIADVWGVPRERVDFFLALYKPRLEQHETVVTIGRASLSRQHKVSDKLMSAGAGFSLTKHSLRLLERLAMCVALQQPVLLVGETGNGKTAVVQHLAQRVE